MEYLERETGAFPISIGTSLAIEGLLQRHPNQARMPPGFKRIRHVWFNLRTLVRNFYASMTTQQIDALDLSQAIDTLVVECQVIPTILLQETQGRITSTIYLSSLDELKWRFPHANYKEPHTDKQKSRHQLEALTLTHLYQALKEHQVDLTEIKREPSTQPGVVAILTHHPHELLWRFQFQSLFLLESHTGKLKSYTQWYTKLKGVKEEDHLPFNAFTLQLFGEGTVFDAFPKKLRDEVKQIGETRRWTAVTTVEKIRHDLDRYGGELLRKTFHELMSRG